MPRGRKPKGEYSDKAATIATRVTAELRSQLDIAAKENGRSLSQEIEDRLRQSFAEKTAREAFGDPKAYAFFRMLHAAVDELQYLQEPGPSWLDDATRYDEAARTLRNMAVHLRPPGSPKKLSKKDQANSDGRTHAAAFIVLNRAALSNPSRMATSYERMHLDFPDLKERYRPTPTFDARWLSALAAQTDVENWKQRWTATSPGAAKPRGASSTKTSAIRKRGSAKPDT